MWAMALCMEVTWTAVCPLRIPRGRGSSDDPSSRTSTEYRNGEDTEGGGMPAGNSSARMPIKRITATRTNKLDNAGLLAVSIIPGWPCRVRGVVSCV